MSTDVGKPLAANGRSSRGLNNPQAPYLVQNTVSTAPAEEGSGIQLSAIWHAFRRRWALGLLIGILLTPLAIVPWLLMEPQSTAVVQLHLHQDDPMLIFNTADQVQTSAITYKLFQSTQAQLIRSDLNISQVLELDSEISNLPQVVAEPDPIEWILENLHVMQLPDTELLNVSFRDPDPQAAMAIANAVVKNYYDKYVKADEQKDNKRLADLQLLYQEKTKELKAARTRLVDLAETAGSGSSESLTLNQQSTLSEREILEKQRHELRFKRMELEAQLFALLETQKHRQAVGETAPNEDGQPVVSEEPVDPSLRAPLPPLPVGQSTNQWVLTEEILEEEYAFDPEIRRLNDEKEALEEKFQALAKRLQGSGLEKSRQQYESDLAKIDDDLNFRKSLIKRSFKKEYERENRRLQEQFEQDQLAYELDWRRIEAERLRALKAQGGGTLIVGDTGENQDQLMAQFNEVDLRSRIKKIIEQEAELEAMSSSLRDNFKLLGKTSADVEMLRGDIASLEQVVSNLAAELERTRVESKGQSKRIEVMAYATRAQKDDPKKQIALTIGVGLAGLFAPLILLMWRDITKQHVDDLKTMRLAIGLEHMGGIPRLPMKQLSGKNGKDDKKDSKLQRALSESVRGIVAQLIRRKASENQNCIMVSSATAGEGKTTASVEISRMLARSGQKTVLIDFDLRRPRIHEIFEVDGATGIYDILTGNETLDGALKYIEEDKLTVIPAGNVESEVYLESYSGMLAELFATLQEQYDFVIVDCCPVLPVVDARIVSEYVDGVILALTRDVSVVPDAISARDILRSHGATVIGTIVSGHPVRGRYDLYN
ncbi:Tyrosine-protein kinase YwqD [Thalassoglobus neptunius]|uniref:non-specific protein-tyrosine kinase n=1 Tax=Thalassoglobus neptunius TaxID=1938619 RepID=A0A5C5X547_9PLAN|nr:AAA family ATPase [Thalassoglobus neptunius]TWT57729.1 Tyrosine-protein kinase YwqD [Thalassoglobus neptunius]